MEDKNRKEELPEKQDQDLREAQNPFKEKAVSDEGADLPDDAEAEQQRKDALTERD